MVEELVPREKFRDETDVELAADGDLNNVWEGTGTEFKTPAQRVTIREALLAQTRSEDAADRLPQSDS